MCSLFFFFNDTATTEIYTLSLHDALPIFSTGRARAHPATRAVARHAHDPRGHPAPARAAAAAGHWSAGRSEEHTSELQSRLHLVCRLLLEKKKTPNHVARERACRIANARR